MDGNEKTEFASWGVAKKGWLSRHFAIVNEVCYCTQGKEMVVSTDDNRFRRMFFYCPFEIQSQSVTSSRMLLTGIPSRWCQFLCLFNLVRFYLVNDYLNSSKRWFNALTCEIYGWVIISWFCGLWATAARQMLSLWFLVMEVCIQDSSFTKSSHQ